MTYREWFDVVALTRTVRAKSYRDGVERAAALAAVEQCDFHKACEEAESIFERYEVRFPRWDGSIA